MPSKVTLRGLHEKITAVHRPQALLERDIVRPRVVFFILLFILCFVLLSLRFVLQKTAPEADGSIGNSAAAFHGREPLRSCMHANVIVFPRDVLVACEGYWRAEADVVAEGPPLDFPKANPTAWCGMHHWLRMLSAVEQFALSEEGLSSGVSVERQRGMSRSRLSGKLLGNKEFTDWFRVRRVTVPNEKEGTARQVEVALLGTPSEELFQMVRHRQDTYHKSSFLCWTGDFGGHYVHEYHVIPTREFFDYVMLKFQELVVAGVVAPASE